MKALLKVLNWLEWISAGVGSILILLGIIQVVIGRLRPQTEIINYFNMANSFFLFTIVVFLFIHLGQYKKE